MPAMHPLKIQTYPHIFGVSTGIMTVEAKKVAQIQKWTINNCDVQNSSDPESPTLQHSYDN